MQVLEPGGVEPVHGHSRRHRRALLRQRPQRGPELRRLGDGRDLQPDRPASQFADHAWLSARQPRLPVVSRRRSPGAAGRTGYEAVRGADAVRLTRCSYESRCGSPVGNQAVSSSKPSRPVSAVSALITAATEARFSPHRETNDHVQYRWGSTTGRRTRSFGTGVVWLFGELITGRRRRRTCSKNAGPDQLAVSESSRTNTSLAATAAVSGPGPTA